jgi:hypothetical protein
MQWTVTEIVDGEERSDRFPTASKALEFALGSDRPLDLVIYNPEGFPGTMEGVGQHMLNGKLR